MLIRAFREMMRAKRSTAVSKLYNGGSPKFRRITQLGQGAQSDRRLDGINRPRVFEHQADQIGKVLLTTARQAHTSCRGGPCDGDYDADPIFCDFCRRAGASRA